MKNILTATAKTLALTIATLILFTLSQGIAKADPVTFTTTGTFSGGSTPGTNVGTFGTTTLTFNGTTNSVNTPVGTSFGDIVANATDGNSTISGNFTLTFLQTLPTGGTGSVVGTLSGSLGINSGIATLTFAPGASVTINGFTYTPNQTYTLAVPVSGGGGGAMAGTTSIQGTVTGSASAVPEPASLMLLGTGLTGLAGAARRKLKRGRTEEV